MCYALRYHVFENYESGIPQGWLARDHDDWVVSGTHEIKDMSSRRYTDTVFSFSRDLIR